jgi:hypothetical protein
MWREEPQHKRSTPKNKYHHGDTETRSYTEKISWDKKQTKSNSNPKMEKGRRARIVKIPINSAQEKQKQEPISQSRAWRGNKDCVKERIHNLLCGDLIRERKVSRTTSRTH